MPEILSPAGNFLSVKAAILNQADAVYMGFSDFNARRNAQNFTLDQMKKAIDFCHSYKAKAYITMNTLIYDRQLKDYIANIKILNELGADAVIVQDLGAIDIIKSCAPGIDIHGSTQLTVHNLDGALAAKELGISRIVLSRELSLKEIAYITKHCGIETEVFVHGALCMCYSGQCYLSAMLGGRSGNRGLCAGTCRLPFGHDNKKKGQYALSLKDLSLVCHLNALKDCGVSSLKIEGRMKRPEYVAIVTDIYKTVLSSSRAPTKSQLDTLERVFSRQGFTDGYFTQNKGSNMFGIKIDAPLSDVQKEYDKASLSYKCELGSSFIYVDMSFTAKLGLPMTLDVYDSEGNSVTVEGGVPQTAQTHITDEQKISVLLSKNGGTPYRVEHISINMDKNLMIPTSSINKLRRDGIAAYRHLLIAPKKRQFIDACPELIQEHNRAFCGFTVSIQKISQLTDEILENPPRMIYINLFEAVSNPNLIAKIVDKNIPVCARLPRIYSSFEKQTIQSALLRCRDLGIKDVLCSNIGQINPLKALGFSIITDFGFNILNSQSLLSVKNMGAQKATLSFEMRFSQMRDLAKCIDIEAIVYGYLPLMIFENCAIKGKKGKCVCKTEQVYLKDRIGREFALIKEFGCRNTLLNSKPLCLLGKQDDFKCIGINYGRICFTTENQKEVNKVYLSYINDDRDLSCDFTRGLYYRGVL